MNPAADPAGESPELFHPASYADYVPRGPLRRLQSQRLRTAVGRAYEHVSSYRQRMHKGGLAPEDILDIDDLSKLPFTVLDDLRHSFPFGMLAVPIQQIVRLQRPSSAMAGPIVAAQTRRDLEVWTEVLVRCLASCGVHAGDVVQNAWGHHRFGDGLMLQQGAESLGATVIPVSAGDADQQLAALKDFDVSVICSTPSYFLHLIERAEQTGVDLRGLALRAGVFLAQPWSDAIRRRIEQSAGIQALAVYGVWEMSGPGIGAECCHRSGLHIFEDHFYPEIVDPATGDPLPDGEEGELVLTTLSSEALPVIRYRTGELTTIVDAPCPCGRTMRQIRQIGRRSDDRLVIQGINVFPSKIEAALLAIEGALPPYRVVLTRVEGLDQIEVQIEVTPQVVSDQVSALEELQNRLRHEIEQALGFQVPVRLVEPHTLSRGAGQQAERIVDRRGIPAGEEGRTAEE